MELGDTGQAIDISWKPSHMEEKAKKSADTGLGDTRTHACVSKKQPLFERHIIKKNRVDLIAKRG